MAVHPKKRLGQHFLVDGNIAAKIVGAVAAPPNAVVVEIGPGEGALTGLLLARYPNLIAVEVDEEAVGHIEMQYPDLEIMNQDVLALNWGNLSDENTNDQLCYVVGNLPYYITSPILFGLLDARLHIKRAVLMMQKEVADRIVAVPGSKTYGILSVQVQLLAKPTKLFSVSRHVFYPKPKVESAVIALDFDHSDKFDFDVDQMKRVVRTAFGQRRKMLRNSLAGLCAELGSNLPERFQTVRPEKLAPSEFAELTNHLFAGESQKS
ncbi:MAG: 16S rRNA (adenine(1518)-N(6)/adenine(1519)-N(6))-dimethyltransferase RsmA [Rubricoccaceae bacterium]|nr:16S rRNA (adenine(1518)-N(6)/adenine(1519)-N(6))-dimethyltransferase RsmA [Rubricoccaceae bacterium]